MTEYVILVGLIGILLVGAVEHYKTQIEVTIVGNEGAGTGLSGGMAKNVSNPISTMKTPKKIPGQ